MGHGGPCGNQVFGGWVADEGGKGREERHKVYEKLRRIDGAYGNTEQGVFRKEGVGAQHRDAGQRGVGASAVLPRPPGRLMTRRAPTSPRLGRAVEHVLGAIGDKVLSQCGFTVPA